MNVEILTKEDLNQVKAKLIQAFISEGQQVKQWLKSAEVRKIGDQVTPSIFQS